MSIDYKIYHLGDSVLGLICSQVPVEQIKAKEIELWRICSQAQLALADFRAEHGYGRAISAPQIGHAIRMIAFNLKGRAFCMFNPEVTNVSESTFTMWDDCLSLPNMMVCVKRHCSISIKFINELGDEEIWQDCPQDISELLQHEIDHLNGILAVDIAVKPSENNDAVISRSNYLSNKAMFDALVDYNIN